MSIKIFILIVYVAVPIIFYELLKLRIKRFILRLVYLIPVSLLYGNIIYLYLGVRSYKYNLKEMMYEMRLSGIFINCIVTLVICILGSIIVRLSFKLLWSSTNVLHKRLTVFEYTVENEIEGVLARNENER